LKSDREEDDLNDVFTLQFEFTATFGLLSIFIQPEGHQDSQVNKHGLTVLIAIANYVSVFKPDRFALDLESIMHARSTSSSAMLMIFINIINIVKPS